MPERIIVRDSAILKLGTGVRLSHDKRRDAWVLMAPERVLVLDEIAAEVVRDVVENPRPISELVEQLADRFDAPIETVRTDVLALLQDLADKRFVVQ